MRQYKYNPTQTPPEQRSTEDYIHKTHPEEERVASGKWKNSVNKVCSIGGLCSFYSRKFNGSRARLPEFGYITRMHSCDFCGKLGSFLSRWG